MRGLIVALASGWAALPSEAAVITVHSDFAQLRTSASGCAELLTQTRPVRRTGEVVCNSFRDEAAGPVLGGPGLSAEAGTTEPPGYPWYARAVFGAVAGGYTLLLGAQTEPAFSSGPSCASTPCEVREASAAASVLWRAEFSVEAGDARLQVGTSPYTSEPWTLRVRDLTTGTRLDSAVTMVLASGRRFALEFEMTHVGSRCLRSCASMLTFLFPDATLANAGRVDEAAVPEPGTARLLAFALALLLVSGAGRTNPHPGRPWPGTRNPGRTP